MFIEYDAGKGSQSPAQRAFSPTTRVGALHVGSTRASKPGTHTPSLRMAAGLLRLLGWFAVLGPMLAEVFLKEVVNIELQHKKIHALYSMKKYGFTKLYISFITKFLCRCKSQKVRLTQSLPQDIDIEARGAATKGSGTKLVWLPVGAPEE